MRGRRRWPSLRGAPFSLVTLALLSCSTLPEYAAPTGELRKAGSVDRSETISYRALTRADFEATEPPPQGAAHTDKLGAATCAVISASPGARFATRSVRTSDLEVEFEAWPVGLRYEARVDRACSWWNPRDVGLPEDYILEHEQIHFALVELEARKLNAAIASAPRTRADTPEDAGARAQEQLDQQVEDALDALIARTTEFDEDTSMGHKPEAQKQWLARVQAELGAGRGD